MNKVATWLRILAVVTMVCGIILGFVDSQVTTVQENYLGEMEEVTEQSWAIFAMYVATGLISGLMLFGFSEIIYILDEKKKINQEQLKLMKDFKFEQAQKNNQKAN